MKRILALVMALMLVFSCAAFAEEEIVLQPSYEGAWVEMDYGLGMYVPADWSMVELTEEQKAADIFAFFSNKDKTQNLQISIGAIGGGSITMETLYKEFSRIFDSVAIFELPSGPVLTYADYERNIFCGIMIDEANGLLYTLNFTPYSEEYAALASEIICTFGYISENE